jgi:hypothetical protein
VLLLSYKDFNNFNIVFYVSILVGLSNDLSIDLSFGLSFEGLRGLSRFISNDLFPYYSYFFFCSYELSL